MRRWLRNARYLIAATPWAPVVCIAFPVLPKYVQLLLVLINALLMFEVVVVHRSKLNYWIGKVRRTSVVVVVAKAIWLAAITVFAVLFVELVYAVAMSMTEGGLVVRHWSGRSVYRAEMILSVIYTLIVASWFGVGAQSVRDVVHTERSGDD